MNNDHNQTLEQKLEIFEKKVNIDKYEKPILKELSSLDLANIEKELLLKVARSLTYSLMREAPNESNDRDLYMSNAHLHAYQNKKVELLDEALIHFINSSDDPKTDMTRYLESADKIIKPIGKYFGREDLEDKTTMMCEVMNRVTGSFTTNINFVGKALRVLNDKEGEIHAVIITPDNPTYATGTFKGITRPKKLFAEYDRKDSLEQFHKNFHGTDGLFAKAYKPLLDCRDKYFGQTHLLYHE